MIYEALGGIALIVALIVFAGWCIYRAGDENGYERCRAEMLDRKLAEARRGRHAKSQPRASAPSPAEAPAAAQPEPRTSLVRSGYRDSWFTPGPVALPRGGAIGVFLERHKDAATARDIDTVLLPPAPAPDKSGAEDTGTMPALSDTGELRRLEALADAWISEHIRSEAIA
jgi:hypothetical protein